MPGQRHPQRVEPGSRAATVLTAAQDQVLDILYRELGLTRIRPTSPDTAPGAGIEPDNDNADPYVTNGNAFDVDWKRLDDHASHVAYGGVQPDERAPSCET